jgi:hypothetical protein
MAKAKRNIGQEVLDALRELMRTIARFKWAVPIAMAGFAAGFAVAETQTQTGRELQFENAAVKVWKSRVLPNDPLPFHRHEHPRVLVALTGGTMKILERTGASEEHVWQTGGAYWLAANPPGTEHQDVNLGNTPIEVMVIELKNER